MLELYRFKDRWHGHMQTQMSKYATRIPLYYASAYVKTSLLCDTLRIAVNAAATKDAKL